MFTQTAKWRQLSAMPTSSRCLLVIMKMCSLCRLCCVAQAPAFRPGPIMTRTESRIARRCRAIRHDSTNPERRRGELTPAAGRTSLPSRLTKQNQVKGCLVQVGNGIELEAVGLQFEPYRWRPCGVTWDSSRTVVVIKLRRTSALRGVLAPGARRNRRRTRH